MKFRYEIFAITFISFWMFIISFNYFDRYEIDFQTKQSKIPVYIDEQTGCQYFSKGRYGITPRMGADGKQICEAKK